MPCPVQGPPPRVAIGISVNSVRSKPQFSHTSHLSSSQSSHVAGDYRAGPHVAVSALVDTDMQREGHVKTGTGVEPYTFKPRTHAGPGSWTQAWGRVSPASKGAGLPTPPELSEEHACCLRPPVCGRLPQRLQETRRQGPGLELLRRQEEPGACGNELGSMRGPGKGVENLRLMRRQLRE